ncbi:TauD/TfdA family dioxygenase [Actinokineospora globicatena]|uniref:TauD/TfdA family dioxygenase n=1 Tax=Actinokineospora globicatena TaxID=103729 RepID=UPI0020A23D99|nr:TauD/TfdA family dioxygenase [Actinokineospora globicatena]MCP2303543.1 Taurine dioxygenase, alpha-ketoglutarate-dependent [Actinokineospora globicatena]GLW79320.1 protein AmbC [Actinokineospora globicatena]GLW86270.1 protein AmbC [Actinokineospora globicatena]
MSLEVQLEPGRTPVAAVTGLPDMATAADWLRSNRPAVMDAVRTNGCVLLRGLPIGTTGDFAVARDILLPSPAGYKEKATPRSDYGHGVFSSTDLPASQPIRLHNENSYTLEFPGYLLFGCLVAPDTGGATTVGDMRAALRLLPEDLVARFADKGWLLERSYSEMAGLPWRTSFATDQRAEVERYCQDNTIGYEWTEDDVLRTRQVRAAVITHPDTAEDVWFNHLAFWNKWTLDDEVRDVLLEAFGADGMPFATSVGDGTDLTRAEADTINAVYDEVTRRETWQVGDIMLVDNILNAHGREAFTGDRKIVVSMGHPIPLTDCKPRTQPVA